MYLKTLASIVLASLLMTACAGVEIESAPVDDFAAANYRYYKWRTEPLPENPRSSDPVYLLDPVMRREVDANLQSLGYVLDTKRAQFSVDYLYAPGLRDGAQPEQGSNISHIPSSTINRQVDQASVDNAIALGGVKETNNIVVQFNDVAKNEVIWKAALTKIVEDANRLDEAKMDKNLTNYLGRVLRDLPPAGAGDS